MTKYTNTEDGTESRVVTLDDGRHSVTLYDLDAGEAVPFAKIFPADRAADAHVFASSLIQRR